jgi:uncharacterized protein
VSASPPGDELVVSVHVRPGGRRDAVEGTHDDALAVRVSAPPADGLANEAVCRLLASAFGVRRRDVEVVSGHAARRKRVRIAGPRAELEQRLAQLRDG